VQAAARCESRRFDSVDGRSIAGAASVVRLPEMRTFADENAGTLRADGCDTASDRDRLCRRSPVAPRRCGLVSVVVHHEASDQTKRSDRHW